MRLGELADELGVSTRWLRKLERAGEIPRAPRDRNGHRRYTAADLERIRDVVYRSGGDRQGITALAEAEPAAELVRMTLSRQHTINGRPYGPGEVTVPADTARTFAEAESRAGEYPL